MHAPIFGKLPQLTWGKVTGNWMEMGFTRENIGALSTFGAGLVYATAFQRTCNNIAPWLVHLITGFIFILVGAMDFTQAMF